MASKAKTDRSDFVAKLEAAEGRKLTLAESVNRFLMKVESGEMGADDKSTAVAGMTKHFSVSKDEVERVLEQQITRRATATQARGEKLSALLK